MSNLDRLQQVVRQNDQPAPAPGLQPSRFGGTIRQLIVWPALIFIVILWFKLFGWFAAVLAVVAMLVAGHGITYLYNTTILRAWFIWKTGGFHWTTRPSGRVMKRAWVGVAMLVLAPWFAGVLTSNHVAVGPGATPENLAYAVEQYYDSCSVHTPDGNALGDCLGAGSVCPQFLTCDASDASQYSVRPGYASGDPFVAHGWVRAIPTTISGNPNALGEPTTVPVDVLAVTPAGAQHSVNGTQWLYAPSYAVVHRSYYDSKAHIYTVDSYVSFAPIAWLTPYIDACAANGLVCDGIDQNDANAARNLAKVNGSIGRTYVWWDGKEYVAHAAKAWSPIEYIGIVLAIIIFAPFAIIFLIIMAYVGGRGGGGGGGGGSTVRPSSGISMGLSE